MVRHVALVGLVAAGLAFSQSDRAAITGTVTDPSGAPIPDAAVTATNISTNVTTQTRTSGQGVYTIPYLLLGTYRVTAEIQGFKRAVKSDVILTGGASVRADLMLEIGTTTEQVEVRAAAPQLR